MKTITGVFSNVCPLPATADNSVNSAQVCVALELLQRAVSLGSRGFTRRLGLLFAHRIGVRVVGITAVNGLVRTVRGLPLLRLGRVLLQGDLRIADPHHESVTTGRVDGIVADLDHLPWGKVNLPSIVSLWRIARAGNNSQWRR